MALTIAIEGKGVIANADAVTNDTGGTGTGDWGFTGSGGIAATLTTESFLYGSSCIAIAMSGATKFGWLYFDIGSGNELDFAAAGAEEDQLIYMWIMTPSPGLCDPVASDGLVIRLGTDTSNFRTFRIGGDDDTNGWDGRWKCFVIDPTLPGSIADSGTYNTASIRYLGVYMQTNSTAKGDNLFIDQMAVGKGLRITGTSTSPWSDIVSYCTDYPNRAWGCVQEREGINYLYGKFWFGDDGVVGANQSFQDLDAGIFKFSVAEYYYDSVWELLHPAAYAGIVIEDDSTYTTTFDDGVIVGTDGGRDGSTFIGHDKLLVTMDLYGGSNTSSLTRLYGTQLKNIRGIINMGDDAQHLFYGGSVTNCGQFDPVGAPIIRNVGFIATRAFETDWTTAYMQDGAAFTDETTDLNDPGVADVNLLPATMVANDAFYFGHEYKFNQIVILISTATDAGTVLAWEYYNGTSWTSLTVTDNTNGFENAGLGKITFTIPGSWAKIQVSTDTEGFFYVRARVTTAGTTQPVASWAWAYGPPSHAALLWNSSINIQKCSFLANADTDNDPGGIEMPDASEGIGMTDIIFSGNDVDLINMSLAVSVDNYDIASAAYDLDDTADSAAQTFVATAGKLTRAVFGLAKTGTPTGNMKAELFATSGGAPTGAALATSNLLVADDELSTTNYRFIEFEFEDEYTLVVSTTYAIAITYTSGTATDYVSVYIDDTVQVHSGEGYSYSGSWSLETWDMYFRVLRDGFIQIDATDSDPSSAEERAILLRGATKIVNSVNLTITVKDEAGVAIQDAQTSIYTDDGNRTELMNEDTLSSGIAQEAYNYTGDQDIVVKVRKASGGTNYVNFSTLGKIESGGYTLLVTLVEDTNNAT